MTILIQLDGDFMISFPAICSFDWSAVMIELAEEHRGHHRRVPKPTQISSKHLSVGFGFCASWKSDRLRCDHPACEHREMVYERGSIDNGWNVIICPWWIGNNCFSNYVFGMIFCYFFWTYPLWLYRWPHCNRTSCIFVVSRGDILIYFWSQTKIFERILIYIFSNFVPIA